MPKAEVADGIIGHDWTNTALLDIEIDRLVEYIRDGDILIAKGKEYAESPDPLESAVAELSITDAHASRNLALACITLMHALKRIGELEVIVKRLEEKVYV